MLRSRWIVGLALAALLAAACSGPADGPAATSASGGTPGAAGGETTPGAGAQNGAQGGARSAVISELRNEVDARPVSAAEWAAASEGEQIAAGGGVRTGDEARVRIDTSEGSIIRIAANTEFTLAELSPQSDDPVTRLRLETGKVWVWVTKALGAGTFEVETPNGVATVRGSLMSVEFDRLTGRLHVLCAEGQCELGDALRQTLVRLTEGQQSEVPGTGLAPLAARRMTRQQVREWITEFPEARQVLQRLLGLLPDETPTPPPPGGGLTACDHAYFPMRPGATWTYQTEEGTVTWTVESVTGDAENATAIMTFSTGEITGTYNWTCSAAGLVSYDFGRLDFSQMGTVAEFSVVSSSGAWMPAPEQLTPGFSWTNAYDLQMKIALPEDAGTGESTLSLSQTSTVTGAEPVSVGGETYAGLQVSQTGAFQFSFTISGFTTPPQSFDSSSTIQMARGVGIVSMTTTSAGFTSTSTLVSYSIP